MVGNFSNENGNIIANIGIGEDKGKMISLDSLADDEMRASLKY